MALTLDQATIAKLAEHLENAELQVHDVTKITDDYPDMDWADAYAIQDEIKRRKLARGNKVAGLKAGHQLDDPQHSDGIFDEGARIHPAEAAGGETAEVRDSVGNLLADGDTVTVIKDLKLKGTSSVIKVGTKVRGIRLVDGDHDIDCRIPGIGSMGLKSQFVKKVAE